MRTSAEILQFLKSQAPGPGLLGERRWLYTPEPFPITREELAELEHLGYHFVRFQQAADLLYLLSQRGRQPDWIAQILDAGKPRQLLELGWDKRFRDHLPKIIRPDLLLTANGWVASELDSLPGGIGLTDWLNLAYAQLGFDVAGGRDGMAEGFASIAPAADVVVSKESADYLPEMRWLVERINRLRGGAAELFRAMEESEWQPLPGRTLYRFFELFDLAEVSSAQRALAAAREGEIVMTPPPKPWLEEKALFALFWLRPLREFWVREVGRRHVERLSEVLPYTWLLNPEPLPYHAALPRLEINSWDELKDFSQKERELILKISGFSPRAWGSRGVVAGSDVPQVEWAGAVDAALDDFENNPWIMQEFHLPRSVEHPYFDPATDRVQIMKGRVRLCPYYFVADPSKPVLGGILATIVPADKKIVHGMNDAILAPCAVMSS